MLQRYVSSKTFFVFILLSLMVIILWNSQNVFQNLIHCDIKIQNQENELQLSRHAGRDSFRKLSDLLMEPVPGNNNIFFLETSCIIKSNEVENSGLLLTKRQACSIESTVKMNPYSLVYLLYTCQIRGGMNDSIPYVKNLFQYSNFKIWRLDLQKILNGTPLSNWNFTENIAKSKWPVEHASDILRYAVLWRYGGTYLDIDVIIRRSLNDLGFNYAAKDSVRSLSDCVMSFSVDGIGHQVMKRCMEEVLVHFDGSSWTRNGPDTITAVYKEICKTQKVFNMRPHLCGGLKVVSTGHFTPLLYKKWQLLFKSTDIKKTLNKFKNSYGVHTWNSKSKEENLNLLIETPFRFLMEEFCPLTFEYSVIEINF